MFHLDVAKVDHDVAHVAMTIHICFKCCICFLDVRCKCFIWMLHMFHTYVASVSSRCRICFAMATHVFLVFPTYVASVLTVSYVCCKCFINVAKVDLMLHMLQWDPSAAAACYNCWARVHARGCVGGASDRRGNGASTDRDAALAWARGGVGNEAA